MTRSLRSLCETFGALEIRDKTADASIYAQHEFLQVGLIGKKGCLLFISSVLSFIPYKNSTVYNTCKAGINHMCRTAAAELAEHRIRANVIEPGWIDTPGERRYATDDEIHEAGKALPWGRLGTIDEVGRAAAFLCSEDAEYITGSVFRVDGGYALQW